MAETNNPENAPETTGDVEAATSKSPSPEDKGQAEVETGNEPSKAPNPSSTAPSDKDGQANEELIAGKFKSTDELVNAYQNLEKKLGKQGNELAELRKTISQTGDVLEEGKPPSVVPPAAGAETDDEVLSTLNEMIEKRASEIVEEKLRPLQVEQEINRAKEDPDFFKLLPEIKNIYKEHPQLRQPGNLKLVLDMARGRQAASLAKDIKEEGKKEALEKVENKKRAITEGGKARERQTELTPEVARKMSLQELEQLLPKA